MRCMLGANAAGSSRFVRIVLVAALSTATLTVAVAGPVGAAAPPPRDPSVFACAPGLTTPFTDVAGTTHAASIACALHYELTGGLTPTTYGPSAPVTRGQMATFLARTLFGADPPDPDGPSDFTDTAGSPHADNIQLLSELGLVLGTGGTTYSPNNQVSRAQMATFLARLLELVGFEAPPSTTDHFTDDQGNVHQRNIQIVADAAITGGTTPTTFSPNAPVNRGAMASFLARTIDLGIQEALFNPLLVKDTYAALTGSAPTARGTAVVVTTDVPGVVCLAIDTAGAGTPASVRIVVGPNATGATLVDVPVPDGGRCFSDPDAAAIAANPGGHLVVVDTATTDGVLAGPLGSVAAEFGAELTDVEVVPGPGDDETFGVADGFTTSVPGTICMTSVVIAESSVGTVTGGLFEGAAHVDGTLVATLHPVVVTVETIAEALGELGLECFPSDKASAIAANPAAFYVEVSTTAFPGGALRGQLAPFVAGAGADPAGWDAAASLVD